MWNLDGVLLDGDMKMKPFKAWALVDKKTRKILSDTPLFEIYMTKKMAQKEMSWWTDEEIELTKVVRVVVSSFKLEKRKRNNPRKGEVREVPKI